MQAFEKHLRENEKSPATTEKYLRDARACLFWLDGRKPTKDGDASYNRITSAGVEITITRATLTGSTLNLNAGTLVWVDNASNILPDTTAVAANTTYKWIFTPTDANYTTLTGSIELYHKSSSSGGSGWYYSIPTI